MHERDRGLAITFNGEIYNFADVRSELQGRGHGFATRSDTEVILKAYVEWGAECVRHLDGMFAFAIWDQPNATVFLARDRFGKKPLYYAYDSDKNLVFASELKALIASQRIDARLSREAVDCYLRLMYVPPTRTIYDNIFVLAPGHTATYSGGTLRKRRYWRITRTHLRVSYSEAKEEVRRLLCDATARRLVADVEVGALLSGGVDSTLVTYLAQAQSTRPIKTFSVGYGDYINELPYAKAASEALGTDHHVLQVGGPTLPDALLRVSEYFDEPHADSSNVAQCLVSQLASTRVKVALCGDGGDEVFLGYDWYWRHWSRGRRARLMQLLFSSPYRDFLSGLQVFDVQQRAALWGAAPPSGDAHDGIAPTAVFGGLAAINRFDLEVYLPGQLLVKADRASMMHSLELRSPLLDRALAEFVFSLPASYKTDRTKGKLLLKDLLREVMPESFVERSKQGFGAPVKDWLTTICRDMVLDLLVGSDAAIFAFLDRNATRRIVGEFYNGATGRFMQVWTLLCLELWRTQHRR
jgi:asparagine synthase (glutamine-hydrolysing)